MKEKVDNFLEDRGKKGRMYKQIITNLHKVYAPKIAYIGEKIFHIGALLVVFFYFSRVETQLLLLYIDMSLGVFLSVSGLVLEKGATDFLKKQGLKHQIKQGVVEGEEEKDLGKGNEEVVEDTAKTTTEILTEGTIFEDFDKDINELIEEEKKELGVDGD